MKKIGIFLFVMVLSLTSCSKSDDDISNLRSNLIGTWGHYKYVDLDFGDSESYDMNDILNQIKFKENGVFVYYDYEFYNGDKYESYNDEIVIIVTEWMYVEKNRIALKLDIAGELYDVHYYIEFDSDNEMRMRQYDIIEDGFEEFNEWDYYKRL